MLLHWYNSLVFPRMVVDAVCEYFEGISCGTGADKLFTTSPVTEFLFQSRVCIRYIYWVKWHTSWALSISVSLSSPEERWILAKNFASTYPSFGPLKYHNAHMNKTNHHMGFIPVCDCSIHLSSTFGERLGKFLIKTAFPEGMYMYVCKSHK